MANKSLSTSSGTAAAPADLPMDAAAYFGTIASPGDMLLPAGPAEPALKQLGPLPFPRGAIPLMGLFASLYDHVSQQALAFGRGIEEAQPVEEQELDVRNQSIRSEA